MNCIGDGWILLPFVIKITVSNCGESLWTNEYNRIKFWFPNFFERRKPHGKGTPESCHVFQWFCHFIEMFRWFFSSRSLLFLKPNFSDSRIYYPVTYLFFVKAGIGWVAFFTRALGDLGTLKSIQVCPKWTFNLNNFSCVREPTPGTETSFGSPTEQNFAKHVLKEKRYVSSNLERNMVFFENTELVRNMIYITFLQHQICLQIQECRMVFVSVFLLNIIDL